MIDKYYSEVLKYNRTAFGEHVLRKGRIGK